MEAQDSPEDKDQAQPELKGGGEGAPGIPEPQQIGKEAQMGLSLQFQLFSNPSRVQPLAWEPQQKQKNSARTHKLRVGLRTFL